jgi:hypothetical protein
MLNRLTFIGEFDTKKIALNRVQELNRTKYEIIKRIRGKYTLYALYANPEGLLLNPL